MPYMLSLAHNPFDPFTEYADWMRFDHREGFDTAGFFARCLSTSDSLSEPDQERAEEMTIDNILANPSFAGLYKKVSRE